MGKIGIFYGSTEGNTEDVVDKVKDALGDADIHNVDSFLAIFLNSESFWFYVFIHQWYKTIHNQYCKGDSLRIGSKYPDHHRNKSNACSINQHSFGGHWRCHIIRCHKKCS